MADKTFRIAWDNALTLTAAVVYASSEQSAFPASAIKLPGLSKGWRSKIGWTIVAGFNDKLDFDEDPGGGPFPAEATLTAGNYATGTAMAAQVQTQMNAAAGLNTYTVSYSTGTHKFTIARATGTAAVRLLWFNGSNVARGVGADLGFSAAANDTGSTSYESDTVSYQSRHYLKADLGAATSISSFHAILSQTFGASATLSLKASASSDMSSPASLGNASIGDGLAAIWFSEVSYRYWLAAINDVQNADGYISVRAAVLAPHLELSRGVSIGYLQGSSDGSTVTKTYGGGLVQAKRAAPKAYSLPIKRLTKSEKNSLIEINEDLGVGRPMVIAIDPQNNPLDSLFMALAEAITMTNSFGDGDPPERWSTVLALIQVKT